MNSFFTLNTPPLSGDVYISKNRLQAINFYEVQDFDEKSGIAIVIKLNKSISKYQGFTKADASIESDDRVWQATPIPRSYANSECLQLLIDFNSGIFKLETGEDLEPLPKLNLKNMQLFPVVGFLVNPHTQRQIPVSKS